jgi:hypothetical protein
LAGLFKLPFMPCLENIVSLKNKCGSNIAVSSSGYYLEMAPEISPLALADIANEKYINGFTLAQSVLNNALLDIKSDFLGVLQANNLIADISAFTYTSSEFNMASTWPAANLERGLTVFKTAKSKNYLQRTIIKRVSVLPLADKEDGEILIYDNGNVYTYPVELTANMINTIEVEHVIQGDYARVLVDGSDLPMSNSVLTCFTGCSGKLPNDCGYTKGYNGTGDISNKEGFGVSVDFSCECDFESILCDMAKTYVGKLIYTKVRIGLLQERIDTTRLNNFIIYGKEEAKERKSELEQDYVEQWNTFIASLPNLLKKYKSDCIICNRTTFKTNI